MCPARIFHRGAAFDTLESLLNCGESHRVGQADIYDNHAVIKSQWAYAADSLITAGGRLAIPYKVTKAAAKDCLNLSGSAKLAVVPVVPFGFVFGTIKGVVGVASSVFVAVYYGTQATLSTGLYGLNLPLVGCGFWGSLRNLIEPGVEKVGACISRINPSAFTKLAVSTV